MTGVIFDETCRRLSQVLTLRLGCWSLRGAVRAMRKVLAGRGGAASEALRRTGYDGAMPLLPPQHEKSYSAAEWCRKLPRQPDTR